MDLMLAIVMSLMVRVDCSFTSFPLIFELSPNFLLEAVHLFLDLILYFEVNEVSDSLSKVRRHAFELDAIFLDEISVGAMLIWLFALSCFCF